MPWRQVASGTYDRDVNPADGAREPEAWRTGGWYITSGADRDGPNANPGYHRKPGLMTQRLSVTKAVLLFSLSLVIASCGPSFEEQQQTREAERLQRVAASEQALATFAESHSATPVEIGFDTFGPRRSFTAQLQDELEGSVVAFRGSLLDIVRTSDAAGDYEVTFGAPFFGGTLVTLSTSERDAAKLLALSPEEPLTLLVAARTDRVAPMILRIEPCREPDCGEVGLEVNRFDDSHRISGRAIAMQLER